MTNVVSLPAHADAKASRKNVGPEVPRPRYTICWKRLIGAYAAEIVIASTAFAGSVLLARKYAQTQSPEDFYLMLLAPLAYVVVELIRVPLALSIRIHPSKTIKIVAVLGVICAAGITTKSMSQLGEAMFRPRLNTVAEAKRNADEAHNTLARHADDVARATDLVKQRTDSVSDAESRLKTISAAIGQQPGQVCNTTVRRDKKAAPYRILTCAKNPATLALSHQLEEAERDRTTALADLDAANAELKRLQDAKPSEDVSRADSALKDALFNSQLHDFTAMVFGIDLLQVTDAQTHAFLRIFVFLPAILAAVASTLLAMTAVTFHQTSTSPDYRLTVEESHRVMQDALAAAAQRVKSPNPANRGQPLGYT
jgi:hypothetical protein